MPTVRENINRMRDYMRNNKAELYLLENHPLANADAYIVDLYLKMLGVVIRSGGEVTEEQVLLLERLLAGLSDELRVEDYLRSALEADEEDLEEFLFEITPLELRYAFIVDSLVLASCRADGAISDQLSFVAELSEQLRLTEEEVRYLSLLTVSIVEQNDEKYQSADEVRPRHVPAHTFVHLTNTFVRMQLVRGEEDVYLSFREKTPYDFNRWAELSGGLRKIAMHQRHIHMENVIIDTRVSKLTFESSELIHLKGCEFIGSVNSLTFKHCKEVRLENCVFRGFTGRTIILEDIDDVAVTASSFVNCVYQYDRSSDDWQALGGVIYSSHPDKVQKLVIDMCDFKECGGSNKTNYYSSAVISNCADIVLNSKFINCWNYKNRNEIDPAHNKRTLFESYTIGQNNEVIASANFN